MHLKKQTGFISINSFFPNKNQIADLQANKSSKNIIADVLFSQPLIKLSMENICKNCGQNFTKNYCNNCGQKSQVTRFTFKHIIEEGFHAFTHADKSLLSYAGKIVVKPGLVAREYIIEKKRVRYFNPFTFFLLATAFSAFIEGMDLDLKEKLFQVKNDYGHIFNLYSKLLYIVAIPGFALITWLLHRKKTGLRYSEYTVYAMMILSVYSIFQCVIHAVNYCFTALLKTPVDVGDNFVFIALFTFYIAYAGNHFHSSFQNHSWVKGIMSGLGFFVVQTSVALFIIYAILNDFKGLGTLDFFGIRIN